MSEMFKALKNVILAFSPSRSFIEAMMKYDFRIGDRKGNLIQLCFSNLASWPLIPILALIFFDPFKYSWKLVDFITFENPLILFFLDGRIANMAAVFVIFFIAEWVFRKEYLLLALVFYFVNRSELHIHLATVGVLGVYASRICYLWRLSVDLESETKKIWMSASVLQFAAWLLIAFTTLTALDYLQINHLFSQTGELSRYNFLVLIVLLYHGFSHVLLSLWGHFYAQRMLEPSHLPIFFSTAKWISKFNMRYYLQNLLKLRIKEQLEKHSVSQIQLLELKEQNPGILRLSVGEALEKELSYLKEAELRLRQI